LDSVNPAAAPRPADTPPPATDHRLLRQSLMLAVVAIGLVWLFKSFGAGNVLSMALVAVGLGFVVFIHELGHFLVAKWCDVHVETFSIGFGPAIPGCSFRRGETLYKIAWFPLGGYVKMVGEGTESEEEDDDPRSFKNKSVWQRMAIISAGVTMNVVLGFVCFIFVYRAHGLELDPAEVGIVDVGSPAWKKGIPTGAVIRQIGDIQDPYFEDLLYEVMLSSKGQQLPFVYEVPEQPGKLVRIDIEPRKLPEDFKPVIGISSPGSLKLSDRARERTALVRVTSAAAQAKPPFESGDQILGTTDPDQSEPFQSDRVKLLPPDPRRTDLQQPDYFEFRRRLKRLAGKAIVLQVRRKHADPRATPVAIHVPPAYHYTFGLRMRMGQVVAVREGSAADRAGVRVRDLSQGIEGDILKQVEVTEPDGTRVRYVTSPGATAPAGVTEKPLDPVRLPDELEQWAARQTGPHKVLLTVVRQVGHAPADVSLELSWDDHWRYDHEVPVYAISPLAIPELGLAYRIENVVEAVTPGSSAAQAGIERGDLVKAFRFDEPGSEPGESAPGSWVELEYDQWASLFWALQEIDFKTAALRIERAKEIREVELTAEPDKNWPLAERGLLLQAEKRLQKASGVAEAVYLGMKRTFRTIVTICLNVRAIVTQRVSYRAVGGPLLIARAAYMFAGEGIYRLIEFLGMISINLAVINFLPIPVLDGGHMVFLVYEKLRGIPASEPVRAIATYVGVMLILALIVFVFWNDITLMLRGLR
jgi:regulator of sigma E protease